MSVHTMRRRFTVDEYLHMTRTGILTERDRVELLDGDIVEMTPIGRRHAACVAALLRVLLGEVGSRAMVWPQGPIRLSDRSQPAPDVALLRLRPVSYSEADAEPRDVLLVIEVAETSLRRDREIKVPLYAAAGIAECWIVDLSAREIEVFREPAGSRYATARRHGVGLVVSPLAFPDVAVDVGAIFR